jgi:hypothetical protein
MLADRAWSKHKPTHRLRQSQKRLKRRRQSDAHVQAYSQPSAGPKGVCFSVFVSFFPFSFVGSFSSSSFFVLSFRFALLLSQVHAGV